MNCKNCGGKTSVLSTRNFGSLVQRVRQCQTCLYLFTTYEEEASQDAQKTGKENRYRKNNLA